MRRSRRKRPYKYVVSYNERNGDSRRKAHRIHQSEKNGEKGYWFTECGHWVFALDLYEEKPERYEYCRLCEKKDNFYDKPRKEFRRFTKGKIYEYYFKDREFIEQYNKKKDKK